MNRPRSLDNVAHERTHKSWSLIGYDTFSYEEYPLEGRYGSLAAARKAADERLAELERTQPSSSSGGQGFGGIQDRVYIQLNCAQCGYPRLRA